MCKLNEIYIKNQNHNIMVANCVWVNDKWKLIKEYKTLVDDLVICMSFDDPSFVADTINNWVSKNTMRRITDIIKPEYINPSKTPLIITNAIYFK